MWIVGENACRLSVYMSNLQVRKSLKNVDLNDGLIYDIISIHYMEEKVWFVHGDGIACVYSVNI